MSPFFSGAMVGGLFRGLKAFAAELRKPKSFVQGEAFEDYVREKIFPKTSYCLVNKAHTYLQNSRDYVESSHKPDFEFRCRDTGYVFHVEAKYRRGAWGVDGTIAWCRPDQLQRYRALDRKEPVFLCLGIGRKPTRLKDIYIIPMNKIYTTDFHDSFLEQYAFCPDKAVRSGFLMWLRMRQC
ncbi:hypothetical protein [Cesiribacter sp. SM1]|uniref:hypothetical protein n=1 Tax=Cesiribacter sp. SM1 TaxID=2861196 RepID=UPI001CD3871D|nr:hypothetical protein [Cesiribacter sp. SM1]